MELNLTPWVDPDIIERLYDVSRPWSYQVYCVVKAHDAYDALRILRGLAAAPGCNRTGIPWEAAVHECETMRYA